MGVYSGPEIINDGLVLSLDAANSKGFDKYENLITHSSMSGWTVGVLGSGGSLPTGWVLDQLQPGSAITIIGGGTENGLNYVDIRFSATSVSTTNRTLIRPGNSVTTDGSTYYLTTYSKLVSGSSTNLTHINFHTGALSLTSTLTRNVGASAVLSGTFFPRYDIGYNGTGVAYDITIRFAAPQLEKGSSATDYYATTGTAKTRGSTWTDLTGRGNNGTLTNGPTYNSSNGGSIVFDGVDDYIINSSTTGIPTGNSSRTIQFWVYPKADTNNFIQLGTGGGGNQVYIVEFYNFSGTRYLFTDGVNGANNLTISGSQLPNLNTWNHIIFGNSGQNWFYYLNGASQASGTFGVTLNTIGQKVIIGKRDDVVVNTTNGNISQVSIYNRALTAAEIQQNYNATKTRYIRVGDGSSASNPAPSASYLVSLGITTNGFYYINLPTVGPTLVYCILDPAVDGGGWMVLWGAAQGATNYTYSFSASRDDTLNSPINGFYSLSYAKRSAINSICTQNKTLVYAGSNSNWLRFDGYIWNSNSHTSGDFRFEFNSSLVTSNGTVDSSVEVGLTNYGVGGGGDFGIAINTDGLDHHSGSYYNLNNGCGNMYLYQYAAGYKVNTGLSGWYSTTAGCTSDNENDLPLLVAMK